MQNQARQLQLRQKAQQSLQTESKSQLLELEEELED